MARTPRRNAPPAQRRSITQQAGRPNRQSGGEPVARRRGLRGVASFAGEVRAELNKVDFPNRQQTMQATLVVLGACILVGVYLWGLDQVFARLASRIISFQKG